MNTNEISPKTNPRLKRIQKVSRILKVCVLISFILSLCTIAYGFEHSPRGMVSIYGQAYEVSDIPMSMVILTAAGTGFFLLGYICLYRLFCLYEKGVIFSEANVLQIKRLGICLICSGGIAVAATIIRAVDAGMILSWWALFRVPLSPWVIIGGTIYVIAWIMNEGRKIQEEQELTV